MVERAWAEDMGQFFYRLDPDTKNSKNTLKITIKNSVPSSLTKLGLYIYMYIYIYKMKQKAPPPLAEIK